MPEKSSRVIRWAKGIGIVVATVIGINTLAALLLDEETPIGQIYQPAFQKLSSTAQYFTRSSDEQLQNRYTEISERYSALNQRVSEGFYLIKEMADKFDAISRDMSELRYELSIYQDGSIHPRTIIGMIDYLDVGIDASNQISSNFNARLNDLLPPSSNN